MTPIKLFRTVYHEVKVLGGNDVRIQCAVSSIHK